MCCLIKDILCSKVELLLDGFNQRTKILNHLIKGLPVLVPYPLLPERTISFRLKWVVFLIIILRYDSDLNHHPCCRQGHKAHWAVLTG